MIYLYLTLLNLTVFLFNYLFLRRYLNETKTLKNVLKEQIKVLGIIGISRGNSR